MKTTTVVQILTLGVLIIASWWAGGRLNPGASSLARPQAIITITQPDGVDDVVGEGDDFATSVLGDPWDMNQRTDILALHGLPGATISNGILEYTSQSSASEVPLLCRGVLGAVDVGKIGVNYPIDADRYRWLSFRIMQPAGSSIQIRWHYAKSSTPYAVAQHIPVTTSDWHTYVIDLETVPKGDGDGATDWEGQVLGLYIVSFVSPGSQVSVDWARLTADNPTGNGLSIAWSGLDSVGATVDFYLDSDQADCDGALIHTEGNASARGSFTWQQPSSGIASPANVAPGDYYVCARVNGELAGYSAGLLTINRAPIIHFTRPGFASGDDYATDAGNPWDMSDTGDIDGVDNGSYTIQDGLVAVTVPEDRVDVRVYLNLPTAIDPNRYYYLTYRLWFDFPYTWDDVGQVTRVFWGRAPKIEATSDLIYVFPGWQIYSFDLRSLELYSGPSWATADWTRFRIDPIANHTGQAATFYVDYIMLTGDEQADIFAAIEWELTDPDSSLTTMELYYDTDNSGVDGTLIATLSLIDGQHSVSTVSPDAEDGSSFIRTLSLTQTVFLPLTATNWYPLCTGECYTWDTHAIAPGTYYLYACISDGYNELCRYSERPLLIDHP